MVPDEKTMVLDSRSIRVNVDQVQVGSKVAWIMNSARATDGSTVDAVTEKAGNWKRWFGLLAFTPSYENLRTKNCERKTAREKLRTKNRDSDRTGRGFEIRSQECYQAKCANALLASAMRWVFSRLV